MSREREISHHGVGRRERAIRFLGRIQIEKWRTVNRLEWYERLGGGRGHAEGSCDDGKKT